jgi:phage N-6-adenine-methyltransferase
MNRHTPMTKADDVRETPPELFNALNEKHRFTLDACATSSNMKCKRFYTEQGGYERHPATGDAFCFTNLHGLTGPWDGRVWCNPPFSEIPAWIAKCWREMGRADGPELIFLLIPATRTEQAWWHRLVEPYRDGRKPLVTGVELRTEFLQGRTHFLKDGKPILDPKTGRRSAPKFGCVGLIWTKEGTKT